MNNTNLYKPGVGFTPDVINEVKPIHADLTGGLFVKMFTWINTERQ